MGLIIRVNDITLTDNLGIATVQGSGIEMTSILINQPSDLDSLIQLSAEPYPYGADDIINLTWNLISGEDYVTLDLNGLITVYKWTEEELNIIVSATDTDKNITGTLSLNITKIWHPTKLTSEDFTSFMSSVITVYPGVRLGPYACNFYGNDSYRNYRMISLLSVPQYPYDVWSTKYPSWGNYIDTEIELNYARIPIPYGCKTVTVKHNNTEADFGLSLNDDYYENNNTNIIDVGWMYGGNTYTLDVSKYNSKPETHDRYYLTTNARKHATSYSDIPETSRNIKTWGLEITFNYD